MNSDPDSPGLRRGQLALTRLLPGGKGAASPESVVFPARVPRKGEAMVLIGFAFALAAAALVVLLPASFNGASGFWLLLAAPAVVHLEILVAAALQTFTAPAINGRIWFAVIQFATLILAASAPGWPRAIAIAAAALGLVEFVAGKVARFDR